MRYTLKDYQVEAVRDVLNNLRKARNFYHSEGDRTSFSLSATTGAGKTVMAAATIEALFFGSDEFDFIADPGAVVLWFSDSPDLNEQTRVRLEAASSELGSRLQVIGNTFAETSFRPGNVYFLNTQKLSRNARLVRGDLTPPTKYQTLLPLRPDDLQATIYDVISNTIENDDITLYFILDEAHRGMTTTTKDRTTIVQRLINGNGIVPPMPIVFGISATVERFESAMKEAQSTGRIGLAPVTVDSALVQASGLLKDDIVLSIPTEVGTFDTVLLTRAVKKIRDSTRAWLDYAEEQNEPEPVVPLLVVQVGDKPTDEDLIRIVDTIYEGWPELTAGAIGNVFGEHKDLVVKHQPIPYVEPQRVQDEKHIRVLLAKSAISTGWDCPRAEVLVSFRPAQDKTHITQLLGRMIRTPLARRIPGNELLNSVDCMLPFFDRSTATSVADMLMKGATAKDDTAESGGGEGRRILFDPVELFPNPTISQDVWDCFAELPTVTIPKQNAKPIRRLTALATALSKDGLMNEAVAEAHRRLHKVLDSRAGQYDDLVAKAREDVLTMRGEEARAKFGAGISYEPFVESADPRAIEVSYKAAERVLSPALSTSYVNYRYPNDDDLLEASIHVASLGLVPEIAQDVEEEADALTREWLNLTRVARKGLVDERQAEYDRIEGMSTRPERISLVTPKAAQADTKVRHPNGTEEDLPLDAMHLLTSEEGTFPVDLKGWELKVLESESQHHGFKGWYRNPGRASKESLAIAYQDPSGDWKALRPDFIFFRLKQDGTIVADIVDPHGYHLADAIPKLRGLADFAEQFHQELGRIEAVAEINGTLRVLDITKPHVRDAIRKAEGAKALYDSNIANDY